MAVLLLSPPGALWKQKALEPCLSLTVPPHSWLLEKDGTDSPPSLGMICSL